MDTTAIVFEQPGRLTVKRLALTAPQAADVVVETVVSGISTGTEKMLFDGSMPRFPGMTYPLVPGYESVARVIKAGPVSGRKVGDTVFVPGASCFEGAAGLFGATADRLVIPGARTILVPELYLEDAPLLALAATAHHALIRAERPVDLIIGHGVLGRLMARLACALGQEPPQVLETLPERRHGADGYEVLDPGAADHSVPRHTIIDASGSLSALDSAIGWLAKGGTLVLAGFYGERVDFAFPPAFMREISVLLSSEFKPDDLQAVLDLVTAGRLSLGGLVTHSAAPTDAEAAYQTAFEDPACLKMVIDWRKAA
ncbi:chlorophyll synthesis pathway protein BchC [Roseibium denhamense]|uniref:3-hydroxyethyl bacteriochlorophyllide a dehydrogenase n=1 Tax=Roseibium denhamense TaxID=76305 RepID=A0ABY1PL77_9HYPH|nr:chlorophyll synthesis pathway protein BchC [Roseibium denhamense]MTI07064.1 chlorophyll synthesis pathway protein BchC [Roseibium denhamense]SMP36438.1 3-hydroxyethyl bacteriochlorophyllide a dehydrogenase [Roseibium denhamense]